MTLTVQSVPYVGRHRAVATRRRVPQPFTPARTAWLILAGPLAALTVALLAYTGPNRWMLGVDWSPVTAGQVAPVEAPQPTPVLELGGGQ